MLIQGRIHEEGAITPSLDGCWPKNRDERPIKSRFYQSQNAHKLSFLISKIKKKFWHGPSPDSSPGGNGTPPHTPHSVGASILAPTALDSTRAFGARPRSASAPGAAIRALATHSGSAPVPIAQAFFLLECGQTDKQTDATECPTHAGGYTHCNVL